MVGYAFCGQNCVDLQLYLGDKLYSLLLSKILHTNIDMHSTVEPEAPEVKFVELSKDPQETQEIFELVPVVERIAEGTNLVGTQSKPRCIYTYDFTIIMQSSKLVYFLIVHQIQELIATQFSYA